MNLNQFLSAVRTVLKIAGSALATHGATSAASLLNTEDVVGIVLLLAGAAWSHFHHDEKLGDASGPSGSGTIVTLLLVFGLFGLFLGCAHIAPGADPIVVTVERAQTVAAPTFDLVLTADDADRGFWRTNAPAYHEFCEWLRADQLAFTADGAPTNVPRAIALQLNLDKVKLDYKASRVSSNAVLEVLATLESAAGQAGAWLTVVTNTPKTP